MSEETMVISEVARKFNIENHQLRDWCEVGLVRHKRIGRIRYIFTDEDKKIEKIIELKEKFGKHAPNEMIREELIKANLMSDEQTKVLDNDVDEEDVKVNSFKEAILLLAQKIEEMDKKIEKKEQLMLPSENSAKKKDVVEIKEQINKLEKDNQRLKEVNDQLLKRLDSIHSAMTEIQKEQGKSIWKRMFTK
ncbi:MerR family transcriptional regulator [Priestia megaterium]|uniref:MerR family transcriptional regulator n=1 Tax=Priestia megaterium TaxID=1404 RepID=UPI0026E31127|nr:MerR family transcriptional regulator [Priestia megaterium]MDO6851408.1 MerR family transcriptional regulator [Priestia megaterium]